MTTRRKFIQGALSLCIAQVLLPRLSQAAALASSTLQPLPGLRRLENTHPQPGEFHAALSAHSGISAGVGNLHSDALYGYNQGILGPLIELEEGMKVTIPFTNHLASDSTVHWHGLPVPPEQDGGPEMPVAPGSTRQYQFTLPPDCTGTYWYHPHPLEGVVDQVSHGLAGPLIIRSKQDPLRHLPEQHWVISDISLNAEGKVPAHSIDEWIEGREGEYILINGTLMPQITLNGAVRIRVWNCCSARYLQLAIPGAQLIQVGSDGGLLSQPQPPADSLLLVPGQRAELLVQGADTHSTLTLLPYDRHKMHSPADEKPRPIAAVKLSAAQHIRLPETLRTIAPLHFDGTRHEVMLMEHMGKLMENHDGKPGRGFWLNGNSFDIDRMDLHSVAGQTDEWTFINATPMDHPMHIHGGQFQLIERTYGSDSDKNLPLAWHDTVNLRPGEMVKLLMHQKQPGMRMYHCHILEHEELGMMGNLMVN